MATTTPDQKTANWPGWAAFGLSVVTVLLSLISAGVRADAATLQNTQDIAQIRARQNQTDDSVAEVKGDIKEIKANVGWITRQLGKQP